MCIFGAVAVLVKAAPSLYQGVEPEISEGTMLEVQPEIVRDKRSQYGPSLPSYGAPCGGGYAVAPLPLAPLPAPASYLPISHGYGASHGYGGYGGGPHYRADDMGDDHEPAMSEMDGMMSEHFPMARYGGGGYGPLPAVHGLGGYGSGLGGGPAYGVFPNANVGGCNVPLLLSCSPSIVPGRLVKSGYGGGGYGAGSVGPVNAYRGVESGHPELHEEQIHSEDHEATHEQLAAVNESSHPTSSHQ